MHEWHCVGPASVEGKTDTRETTFVNKQLQMNKRKTQANKREGRYWRRLSLHTTLCYSPTCWDEYDNSVRFNLRYERLLLSSANGTQMTFSGRGLFAVKPVKKREKKVKKKNNQKAKTSKERCLTTNELNEFPFDKSWPVTHGHSCSKGKRKVGNFGVVVVFTPDLPMLLTPTWLHKKNILKFN